MSEPWTLAARYEFLDQAPKLGANVSIYAEGALVTVFHNGTYCKRLVRTPADARTVLDQLRVWKAERDMDAEKNG